MRIPRSFDEEVDVVEVGHKQDLDGVGLLADAAIEKDDEIVDVVDNEEVDGNDEVDDASSSVLSSSLSVVVSSLRS